MRKKNSKKFSKESEMQRIRELKKKVQLACNTNTDKLSDILAKNHELMAKLVKQEKHIQAKGNSESIQTQDTSQRVSNILLAFLGYAGENSTPSPQQIPDFEFTDEEAENCAAIAKMPNIRDYIEHEIIPIIEESKVLGLEQEAKLMQIHGQNLVYSFAQKYLKCITNIEGRVNTKRITELVEFLLTKDGNRYVNIGASLNIDHENMQRKLIDDYFSISDSLHTIEEILAEVKGMHNLDLLQENLYKAREKTEYIMQLNASFKEQECGIDLASVEKQAIVCFLGISCYAHSAFASASYKELVENQIVPEKVLRELTDGLTGKLIEEHDWQDLFQEPLEKAKKYLDHVKKNIYDKDERMREQSTHLVRNLARAIAVKEYLKEEHRAQLAAMTEAHVSKSKLNEYITKYIRFVEKYKGILEEDDTSIDEFFEIVNEDIEEFKDRYLSRLEKLKPEYKQRVLNHYEKLADKYGFEPGAQIISIVEKFFNARRQKLFNTGTS